MVHVRQKNLELVNKVCTRMFEVKRQATTTKAQWWGISVEEYGALVHYNEMSGKCQLRSKGLSQKKNQHKRLRHEKCRFGVSTIGRGFTRNEMHNCGVKITPETVVEM